MYTHTLDFPIALICASVPASGHNRQQVGLLIPCVYLRLPLHVTCDMPLLTSLTLVLVSPSHARIARLSLKFVLTLCFAGAAPLTSGTPPVGAIRSHFCGMSPAPSSSWAGTGGTIPKTDPRNLMRSKRSSERSKCESGAESVWTNTLL